MSGLSLQVLCVGLLAVTSLSGCFELSYTQDGDERWLSSDGCNNVNVDDIQPVTVSLDTPQIMTWLRVVVNESANLDQITIDYTEEAVSSDTLQCPSDQRARVDEITMDIACPSSDKVTKVTLSGTGVGGLCSLYINAADTECDPGMYGLQCDNLCNCADKNESCLVSTGGCPSGCAIGYTGEDCQSPCDTGRFGPSCQYLCHCENSADCDKTTGTCTDGTCETGWFGPACQYESSSYTVEGGGSWLSDDSMDSCSAADVHSVTVSLDTPQPLLWIRLVVSDSADLDQVDIAYKDTLDQVISCVSERAKVDDRTVDISCPSSQSVAQITLSSSDEGGFCSLYISGGRNVALLAPGYRATQSSTYEPSTGGWWASNAVDGENPYDKGYDKRKAGCTQTLSFPDIWWELTFGARSFMASKFVVWGRSGFLFRLDGFTLKALDDQDQVLYSHNDTTTSDTYKEYIIAPASGIIASVNKIRVTIPDRDEPLELCELFAFGDSDCPAGKYGRECENDCHCLNGHACFVSTGGCPSGCALGFTGVDCYTSCASGWYGSGCTEACSVHCGGDGNLCRDTDGVCENQVCDPGYTSARCDEPCADGSYGQNCQGVCSDYCTTANRCDNVDGSCDCTHGYLPPVCKDPCPEGYYGNCSIPCSDHCKGDSNDCYHVDGSCDQGCEAGYQLPVCKQECIPGTYGEGCESVCSTHCVGNSTCNIFDGSCPSGCVDGYEPPLCQQEMGSEEGGGGGDSLLPVIIAVVLVVVLVAVVAGVILWRRRRSSKGKSDESSPLPSPSPKPSPRQDKQASTKSNGTYELDIPTKTLERQPPPEAGKPTGSTAIPVEGLKAYIVEHSEGPVINDQFQSVPLEMSPLSKDGTSAQNIKKNRFKNILPYDATRVMLRTDAQNSYGDYINASHIKDYQGKARFIASQGPNDAMQNDFMRMIWEQKIHRIVMLTNVVEKRKKKCNVYWPLEGNLSFGTITVKSLATETYADYTVRHLELCESGESVREVTQFHFTAWPDKLVPHSPWGLIDFYHRVMERNGDDPLLVHCSAGVGRTGTSIALCQLLQEAELTGHMDFLSTLSRLRQDRMSMIQTVDQYKFLHWAALVGHVTSGTSIPAKDVASRLKALQAGDGLKKEFQKILDVSMDELEEMEAKTKSDEEVYLNSPKAINETKNRYSDILPKVAHQVYLSDSSHPGDTYINAVFVPSLWKERHDILTQLPLPSTVNDFWRMVTQHQVGLIVAFDTDMRGEDETIGAFIPFSDEDSSVNALFDMKLDVAEETALWRDMSLISVRRKNSIGRRKEKSAPVSCLMVKRFELSSQSLYRLMKKIKSLQVAESRGTLFTCRNGASLSGLASVQSILLDKMKTDQCLSVPLVVGAMKAIRPQVIPTVDQYKLLYEVLQLEADARAQDDLKKATTTNSEGATLEQDSDNIYSNMSTASAPPATQNNDNVYGNFNPRPNTTATLPPPPPTTTTTASQCPNASPVGAKAEQGGSLREKVDLPSQSKPALALVKQQPSHDSDNVYGNMGDMNIATAASPSSVGNADRDVEAARI